MRSERWIGIGHLIIYRKYVTWGFLLLWFIYIFLSLMFERVIKQLVIALKGLLLRYIHAGLITLLTNNLKKELSFPTVQRSQWWGGHTGLHEEETCVCSHHGSTGSRDKLQHIIAPSLVIYLEQFDSASSHLHQPAPHIGFRTWACGGYFIIQIIAWLYQ